MSIAPYILRKQTGKYLHQSGNDVTSLIYLKPRSTLIPYKIHNLDLRNSIIGDIFRRKDLWKCTKFPSSQKHSVNT